MGKKNSDLAIQDRRRAIREYLLQGVPDSEILAKLGISMLTYEKDKAAIAEEYATAVSSSKELMEKQAEFITKHLEQLGMVKKRLWEIANKTGIDDRTQLEALKTAITELEHESRILKLIDTSKTIIKNYVHVDKINVAVVQISDIIKEFVPPDKQQYAFSRLAELGKSLDVETAELVEDPKDKKNEG